MTKGISNVKKGIIFLCIKKKCMLKMIFLLLLMLKIDVLLNIFMETGFETIL